MKLLCSQWSSRGIVLGGGEGKPLGVVALSAAINDLHANHPIELARDTAPLIGDGDDIIELLAAVDGDGDLTPLCF